jgi:hypothetical protein
MICFIAIYYSFENIDPPGNDGPEYGLFISTPMHHQEFDQVKIRD